MAHRRALAEHRPTTRRQRNLAANEIRAAPLASCRRLAINRDVNVDAADAIVKAEVTHAHVANGPT